MATAAAAHSAESPFITSQQQRAQYRSKRRADQLHQPSPTITILSPSLLHIPAGTFTTSPAPQLDTLPSHDLPSTRVQQLSDGLLLFPPPTAETAVEAACVSPEPLLVVSGGPTRWTGIRAFPGLTNIAPLWPHDFISQLHHTALTTPPSTALTQSAFISAPPAVLPSFLSSPDSPSSAFSSVALSLDHLKQTTKRLKRERRALMANMARDVRVVSACVGGGRKSDDVDAKVREADSSAGAMLECAVRRLADVHDQLLLLSAVMHHQTVEGT